jgi:hypothetical protein
MAAVQVARLEIAAGVSRTVQRPADNMPPVARARNRPHGAARFRDRRNRGRAVGPGVPHRGCGRALDGGGSIAGAVGRISCSRAGVLRPVSSRAGLDAGHPVPVRRIGEAWSLLPASEAPELSNTVYATARIVDRRRSAPRVPGGGPHDVAGNRGAPRRRAGVGHRPEPVRSDAPGRVPRFAWTATDRAVEITSFRMLGQVAIVF